MTAAELEQQQVPARLEHEIRKSRVRVYVTYIMTWTYAVSATFVVVWLLVVLKQPELALGVFSGLASTTAAITAFWFGSRGSAAESKVTGRERVSAPRTGSQGEDL